MPVRQEISLSTKIREIALELYAAAYNGIRTYFRYPMWIISDLITSPLWLLLFIIPMLLFLPPEKWSDPTTYQYFYWGMIFLDVISMALWSFGSAIRWEQQTGTLEYLYLTNASRLVLFATRMCSRLISFTMSALYLALLMTVMFGAQIKVADPLLLLLSLFLSLFTALGFGAIYAALVLKLKQVGPLNNILQYVLIGVSGIFFPVDRLPLELKVLAYLSPFTYCVDLVRAAAMKTTTIMPLWHELALIVLLAVLMNFIGIKILGYIEATVKKTGKLGVY